MKKFKYQTGKAKEEIATPTGPPTPTKFEKPVFKKSEKVNHRAIKSMINDQGDIQSAKTGGKMLKRADGSYSQRGLWDNIRANKGSGKKPTKEMLKQEKKIKSKKYLVGGPENPSPTPTPSPAPSMSFEQAFKEYSSGRMTAAQANAASGYGNKQKKYTDAENIDNIKKVFVGSHKVDAQGNVVPKETGGPKSERVQNRANKVTAKSAENKQKALQAMQGPLSTEKIGARSPAEDARYKYERLMNKSSRQEGRAAKLQERADFLKAYGKKTGGTSNWLMESKELMFGGATDRYGNSSSTSRKTGGKKRMGGKNC